MREAQGEARRRRRRTCTSGDTGCRAVSCSIWPCLRTRWPARITVSAGCRRRSRRADGQGAVMVAEGRPRRAGAGGGKHDRPRCRAPTEAVAARRQPWQEGERRARRGEAARAWESWCVPGCDVQRAVRQPGCCAPHGHGHRAPRSPGGRRPRPVRSPGGGSPLRGRFFVSH